MPGCRVVAAAAALLIYVALLHEIALADLSSDRQSLLAFAFFLPHGRKLNWSSVVPVCSWVGVTCAPDGSRVVNLRLPGVGLVGPIPTGTISNLDGLEVLSLRSNRLTDLPPNVSSLPALRSLFLQHNNLSGAIPSSLSPGLKFLDLSHNSFTGEIPLAVKNLTRLNSLFLENNFLSGAVPEMRLPELRYLNLSNNNFSGPIPESFRNFSAESFLNNPFLCGPPLPVACPGSPLSPSPSPAASPRGKGNFWKKLSIIVKIAILAGGAILVLMAVIICTICALRRKSSSAQGGSAESGSSKGKAVAAGRTAEKSKEQYSSGAQDSEKNKLVFFEDCSYHFDLEDLLRASAEVLGKGSYGTTYKAILEDSITVVVKRLKDASVGKRDFEQQMEVVHRVGQHRNVVPLRAYYYSKDEKLLVFDYAPSGNLAALLHGSKISGRTPLDWETRLKISTGVARGLAHIHAEGGGRFNHGNIKSSNVLISPDREGRITEYGLAQLMTMPHHKPLSKIIGYRSPEVLETRKPTQKSDVYSFGVLLLEMLTGKAPLRSPGREGSVEHLPRWVQSVVREEWTAEVFDTDLLRDPSVEEEMVLLLQVAMQCVAKSPEQRPRMADVVKMITEIRNASDSDNNRPPSSSPEERAKR